MIKIKPNALIFTIMLTFVAACSSTDKRSESSTHSVSQEIMQQANVNSNAETVNAKTNVETKDEKIDETKPETKDFTECRDPRPMICTLEYNPVCGFDQQGQAKLYASPCDACGKQHVVKFYMGECEI